MANNIKCDKEKYANVHAGWRFFIATLILVRLVTVWPFREDGN